MNLTGFPISAAAAALGIVSIGGLYALHHLRIQPHRRPAATLLFWRQAVRPQQTRALWSPRFTHRKTFALLAMILLLLAAALTADRWASSSLARRDAIVIDAGAATGATDSAGNTLLANLTAAARADLHKLPGGAAVIAAGSQPTLLSPVDAPTALAARQINALVPQAGASAGSLAILMAGDLIGNYTGNIHWYTDQTQLPAGLPDEIAKRVVMHTAAAPDAAVIAGVTFTPSDDDNSKGTLHVRLAGNNQTANARLDIASDGSPTASRPVPAFHEAGDIAVDDQSADGRLLHLQLKNLSGAAATHTAEYRLPDRRPLTFRFGTDVPTALKLALKTAGVEADNGTVYVGLAGMPVPTNVKAAILVVNGDPGVTTGQTLKLSDTAVVRGLDLEGATTGEGPAVSSGGTALITANGSTVASLDIAAGPPTLLLSRAIVGPSADLPRHAAFPVLLGRLCDALANRGEPVTAMAVGRSAEDPLWAGPSDAPGVAVTAVADLPVMDSATIVPAAIDFGHGAWPWTELVLVLAFLLLAVDASLRAARKIV